MTERSDPLPFFFCGGACSPTPPAMLRIACGCACCSVERVSFILCPEVFNHEPHEKREMHEKLFFVGRFWRQKPCRGAACCARFCQMPVTSRGDRPWSPAVWRHHPDGALRGVPAEGVDAYLPQADSGVGGAAPTSRPSHGVRSLVRRQ